MSLDKAALLKAYSEAGIGPGASVYVTGTLASLGRDSFGSKEETLSAHYSALRELLGERGTLVVPTFSFFLCNTDTPFDPKTTRSETGILTSYVMRQEGAIRRFHPFASMTAIGAEAKYVCENTSRHGWGCHTPFARMLDLDGIFLAIGMHPRFCISLVHHCEMEMGVPYRYTKEFMHPVVRDGTVVREPFYHFCTYLTSDIVRDQNRKFLERFESEHPLRKAPLGRGQVYSLSMRQFRESTNRMLRDDIYAWLARPPEKRPYQR